MNRLFRCNAEYDDKAHDFWSFEGQSTDATCSVSTSGMMKGVT